MHRLSHEIEFDKHASDWGMIAQNGIIACDHAHKCKLTGSSQTMSASSLIKHHMVECSLTGQRCCVYSSMKLTCISGHTSTLSKQVVCKCSTGLAALT